MKALQNGKESRKVIVSNINWKICQLWVVLPSLSKGNRFPNAKDLYMTSRTHPLVSYIPELFLGGGAKSTITEATIYWRIVPASDEFGTVGGMLGRWNRSTRRKPSPVPLCPPQILCDLIRARTRGAAVGSPATSRLSYDTAHPQDFVPCGFARGDMGKTCDAVTTLWGNVRP
jgi:hypothetical protein